MSALSRIRVLELSEAVAGEYCGKLLSDFGAEVIKIERPGGSPTRALGPFGGEGPAHERSALFAFLNTNKSSVSLDLSTPAGRETLAKLVAQVDVVIDDHPPGWLNTVGLDPQRLQETQPGLVLCAITSCGQSPPEDRLHSEDLTDFHASGWGYCTPSVPDLTKPPLKGAGRFGISYEAAHDAALCICAALYDRETSKRGRCIDISKQAAMASRCDYVLGAMVAGDQDVSSERTAFDLWGPAGIFQCREGYVYFWVAMMPEWEALRELLGKPAWMDEDFPHEWLRVHCTPERVARFRHHFAEWIKTQDRNTISAEAQKRGMVMVPVNDPRDIEASPQYAFRQFFTEVTHPVLGTSKYPTVPYKMSETPAKIETPAPLLGQHTEEKLAMLNRQPAAAAGR